MVSMIDEGLRRRVKILHGNTNRHDDELRPFGRHKRNQTESNLPQVKHSSFLEPEQHIRREGYECTR